MTRAIYNADNTITELPGMQKPKKRVDQYRSGSREYYQASKVWYLYNKQKDQCRTIPCSPECRGLWAEGQVLEENRDYEIKGAGDWKWATQLKGNVFAAPVVAVKSEAQLWIEVVDLISIGTAQELNKTDYMQWRWNWIAELKKHYTLIKK